MAVYLCLECFTRLTFQSELAHMPLMFIIGRDGRPSTRPTPIRRSV